MSTLHSMKQLMSDPPQTYKPRPPAKSAGSFRKRPQTAPGRQITNGSSNPKLWRSATYAEPTVKRRKFIVTLNHKSDESAISRNAPFGTRKFSSAMSVAASTYSKALAKNKAKEALPTYNPLNDPHLKDYYARKFGLINATMETRRGTSRQAGIAYQITVKTGDVKGADTDAKVCVQLIGTKDKIAKKRLFKKQESDSPEKGNYFKFERGTVEKFAFRNRDIGDPVKLVIEHNGNEKRHSWFLEELTFTNTQTKKSWLFPCHKWLSKYEGERKLSYELKPLIKAGKAVYEVSVLTGDKRGAGTDANVYVTLFGKHTNSPKIQLLKSSKHKNPFERNKTDEFKIRTRDVAKIQKIRIEHDNTGFGPGWFLDKVIISNLEKPAVKYYCPCSQWLAKDVGDKSISRDLTAYTDPNAAPSAYIYIVHTFTGSKRGAGTDANVFIVIFGESGDTGEKRLDNAKNNFEKSRKDTFKVSCTCVGKLERIRIRHDNSGLFAGWYLDKVVVEDPQEQQTYTFYCGRWLSKTEDDGEISRELMVSTTGEEDDSVAPKGFPYHINVATSDVRNAGTDAEVYVIMYGQNKKGKEKNSGKIALINSEKKKNKFERGMTDIFHIECTEMLSPLTRLTVGHDNKGVGAGWHLDRIVIDCPTTGILQTFLCQQWLDKKEGDGLIERELVEAMDMRKKRRPKQIWFAWVWTSDIRGAGTDAKVTMQIYGDQGKTEEVVLANNTDNFEQGCLDKFKIEIEAIGVPYKLRIGHDNSNNFPGWHLDKIKLENMAVNEQFMFNCSRWLAKSEEDGEIVRELPATGPNCILLPVVVYEVSVHTGSKLGGGTDANVFLKIYGEFGDTGYRSLKNSKTNKNKFERKQVDVFHIEAVTLKALKKIKIGHDGNNPGAGWFLDKVIIKELNGEVSYEFPCDRWLSKSEDDGQIVRELFLKSDTPLLHTTSYHISTKTGDVRNAGTDANVYIQIFGAKDDTGQMRLKQSLNTSNKFERNRIDKFVIEAADIGKVDKIKIGHDGAGLGSGWFLDYVDVDVPSVGKLYHFACHQWFDSTEGDRQIERELHPTNCIKSKAKIPYQISVHTGDVRGAGTDANVFIVIYGENGKTEEMKLRNKSDNFERAHVDVFKIECEDVGAIRKLRIGHDSAGLGSAWFLDKVYVRRLPPDSDKKTRRDSVSKKEVARTSSSEPEKLDENTYLFAANRWLSKEEGDRQTVIELSPVGVEGALQDTTYSIHVHTGNKFGSGTNANVFLNMYGEEGDSGERQLKKSETHVNKFERNQEDIFKINCLNLGKLKKVKIRHDNSGFRPAWFLDRIEIETSESKFAFPCSRWLAKDEDDGQISRELLPQDGKQSIVAALGGSEDLQNKVARTTYNIFVTTGDVKGAGTDANVHVILYGENDDTGILILKNSATHSNKFERNQTDEFIVEAIDIGELKKVKIGHDNKGGMAGWFLNRLEIDIPSQGRRLMFPCGRWLDKGKDDGALERELFPLTEGEETYQPHVPYELTIYTSDKRNAATGANVYIVVYGEESQTQQYFLEPDKKRRKDYFKTGAVDRFVLEMDDVGEEITKLRIGHDGKGWGAGWHLNKVEICRLFKDGKASKQFTFLCDRWLATDKEDGAIVRELVPSEIVEKSTKKDGKVATKVTKPTDGLKVKHYTVHVFTGKIDGAGTNANVFLSIFGENGDSGERKLAKSDTHYDKFERNQEDIFHIEAADLGKLYRIRIRHDNSMFGPSWFLDRVEIVDDELEETSVFHCERWLAKNKDDGKIERSLYVKGWDGECSSIATTRSKGSSRSMSSDPGDVTTPTGRNPTLRKGPTMASIAEKVTAYNVKVIVGDESSKNFQDTLSIELFGDADGETSGIIELSPENKDDKAFSPGKITTFYVSATEIDDIKKVQVSHNSYMPDAGIYLKEIEIDAPTLGNKYSFPCNRWLAKDKDDGKTSRIFTAANAQVTSYRALKPYQLTIHTGDVQNAGTDAKIFIVIFGSSGKTPEIKLEKNVDRFERAKVDIIPLELDDVGTIKKIRIGHDGKSSRPDWFLEKLTIQRMDTLNMYMFRCNQWLSKKLEDKQLVREIAAETSEDGAESIKKTSYVLSTHTTDKRSAGTDANVFAIIFGENGDSGQIALKKSETNRNKFERGQTDVFLLKDLLSLGRLTKLRIWHDNSGFGASWHLASVDIVDENTEAKFVFPCDKWLSKKEGDKLIVRELPCADVAGGSVVSTSSTAQGGKSKKTEYEIIVTTGDEKRAGTNQDVTIEVVGSEKSKALTIENSEDEKHFSKGKRDKFTLTSKPLGDINKVIVTHSENDLVEPSSKNPDWQLKNITVVHTASGSKFKFPCNKWIKLDDEVTLKCKSADVVTPAAAIAELKPVKYEVTVVTADEKSAGTDANVSIIMYGEHGDTGLRPLKKRFVNLFERNQHDQFIVEALDLGKLTKLHIEHDNKGWGAGWLLDRVEIRNMDNNESTVFPCKQWLDKKKGDGQIARDLLPANN